MFILRLCTRLTAAVAACVPSHVVGVAPAQTAAAAVACAAAAAATAVIAWAVPATTVVGFCAVAAPEMLAVVAEVPLVALARAMWADACSSNATIYNVAQIVQTLACPHITHQRRCQHDYRRSINHHRPGMPRSTVRQRAITYASREIDLN